MTETLITCQACRGTFVLHDGEVFYSPQGVGTACAHVISPSRETVLRKAIEGYFAEDDLDTAEGLLRSALDDLPSQTLTLASQGQEGSPGD